MFVPVRMVRWGTRRRRRRTKDDEDDFPIVLMRFTILLLKRFEIWEMWIPFLLFLCLLFDGFSHLFFASGFNGACLGTCCLLSSDLGSFHFILIACMRSRLCIARTTYPVCWKLFFHVSSSPDCPEPRQTLHSISIKTTRAFIHISGKKEKLSKEKESGNPRGLRSP